MRPPHYLRLRVLGDAEDVAVGVLEPGDLVTVGRGPDAEVAILNEGIFFADDAALIEPSDDGGDVLDFPAEDSALERREIGGFGDADGAGAGAHHERVLVQADELKAEG